MLRPINKFQQFTYFRNSLYTLNHTTSAVALCKVTPLDHKVLNNPVEFAAFVALTLWFLG